MFQNCSQDMIPSNKVTSYISETKSTSKPRQQEHQIPLHKKKKNTKGAQGIVEPTQLEDHQNNASLIFMLPQIKPIGTNQSLHQQFAYLLLLLSVF